MTTRRSFLSSLLALAGTSSWQPKRNRLAAASPTLSAAGGDLAREDLTQFVRPGIGTGGHGHTYPGATVPFGMVQLSPDTYNDEWDWCSGYHHSDSSIMGFSHTHLSGTGVGDMPDFLLMPGTGPVKLVPGSRENPDEGYRSRFDHSDEIAEAGYYSVLLKDYGIRAELSATERAGIHKYTFPRSASSHFILDLAHKYGSPEAILWSEARAVDHQLIVGGRSVDQWAKGRQLYFAMKFSRPFDEVRLFSEDHPVKSENPEAQGKLLKCALLFQTSENERIGSLSCLRFSRSSRRAPCRGSLQLLITGILLPRRLRLDPCSSPSTFGKLTSARSNPSSARDRRCAFSTRIAWPTVSSRPAILRTSSS